MHSRHLFCDVVDLDITPLLDSSAGMVQPQMDCVTCQNYQNEHLGDYQKLAVTMNYLTRVELCECSWPSCVSLWERGAQPDHVDVRGKQGVTVVIARDRLDPGVVKVGRLGVCLVNGDQVRGYMGLVGRWLVDCIVSWMSCGGELRLMR